MAYKTQMALQEYLKKYGNAIPPESKNYMVKKIFPETKYTSDEQVIMFSMYFDSKCPACKRMFSTLKVLKEKGYYVEAIQLDKNKLEHFKWSIPVRKVSKAELLPLKNERVPLTIVMMKNKEFFYIRGYQTVDIVFKKINEFKRRRKK
jgi:hypothetical protein